MQYHPKYGLFYIFCCEFCMLSTALSAIVRDKVLGYVFESSLASVVCVCWLYQFISYVLHTDATFFFKSTPVNIEKLRTSKAWENTTGV